MNIRVLIFAGFGANYELAGQPLLEHACETATRLGDAAPLVLHNEEPQNNLSRLCQDTAKWMLFLEANKLIFSEERLSALLPAEEERRGLQLLKEGQGTWIAACADQEILTGILTKAKTPISSLDHLVQLAQQQGVSTNQHECDKKTSLLIGNPTQLAQAETIMQERLRKRALQNGACLQEPASVYFSFDTQLEADVFVEPHVFFAPGVQVGRGARIRAFSYLEGCTVAPRARIGPYARLRPQSRIGAGARIGNFVEIKQADVGTDAKISHLAYIGDARVGARANIGAGAITCNYDGTAKHQTAIEEDAFIGSNSSLVAPVRIGKGAYIGSGSTITEDVEAGALAVARARQNAYPGRAKTAGKKRGKS